MTQRNFLFRQGAATGRQAGVSGGMLSYFVSTGGTGASPPRTQLEPIERMRYRQILEARFYDYENLFGQYKDGFVSQSYWDQRILPAIKVWAPRWNVANPPDGPSGRQEFKEEIRRILQNGE